MDKPTQREKFTYKQRAAEHLERWKREEQEQTKQRREDRKLGIPTSGLLDHLRNCNPKQLKRAIKFARQRLKHHKHPPDDSEVINRRNAKAKVLASVIYKNKRYRLERRSCGKETCRKCPHGAHVYSYQRDGGISPETYIKDAEFSQLPKPIRDQFRPILEEFRARPGRRLRSQIRLRKIVEKPPIESHPAAEITGSTPTQRPSPSPPVSAGE